MARGGSFLSPPGGAKSLPPDLRDPGPPRWGRADQRPLAIPRGRRRPTAGADRREGSDPAPRAGPAELPRTPAGGRSPEPGGNPVGLGFTPGTAGLQPVRRVTRPKKSGRSWPLPGLTPSRCFRREPATPRFPGTVCPTTSSEHPGGTRTIPPLPEGNGPPAGFLWESGGRGLFFFLTRPRTPLISGKFDLWAR